MIDFYPTPPALVSRMLSEVDWRIVSAVLEPSAGKGDLADAIKRRSESARGYHQPAGVDCIELDANLQHILRGKGHNVIHDDFLTFRTVKRYDVIVANFPFSDGDSHMLHAIDLLSVHGGQLVALVNAETLRNPYTRERQRLAKWLASRGAQIEEIAGAFVDAERPTDVTVALVSVRVPRESRDAVILDSLIDATTAGELGRDYETQHALVDDDPVQNMLARFQLECRAGAKLIAEYEALKPLMLDRMSLVEGDGNDEYAKSIIELKIDASYTEGWTNGYVRATRHKYWHALIGNPTFRANYTSSILGALDGKLDQLAQKDFTLFNIRQLEAELRAEIPNGIEDAILSLFDDLSRRYAYVEGTGNNIHYYDGWKSNKAHKINRKVIVPINGFSSWPSQGKDRLDTYKIVSRLSDMVKVFQYLDGQPLDSMRLAAFSVERANEGGKFRNLDLHYFTATFFKKGTCHIQFKDQDLLDKFNIFGSQRKGWLPPSYGRRRYRDMDAEERAVVDAYQGEAAYEAVCDRADYFLASVGAPMLGMAAA